MRLAWTLGSGCALSPPSVRAVELMFKGLCPGSTLGWPSMLASSVLSISLRPKAPEGGFMSDLSVPLGPEQDLRQPLPPCMFICCLWEAENSTAGQLYRQTNGLVHGKWV